MQDGNYKVCLSCKARRMVRRLPCHVQSKLERLVFDLGEKGPIQRGWRNFSVFYRGNYHCHLDRDWTVFWRFDKDSRVIEIYYAGSRESAPCDGRG